jgi:hypothetical protein
MIPLNGPAPGDRRGRPLRTPSGLAAAAGVCFYRVEAGPWRDRKKMVLLP